MLFGALFNKEVSMIKRFIIEDRKIRDKSFNMVIILHKHYEPCELTEEIVEDLLDGKISEEGYVFFFSNSLEACGAISRLLIRLVGEDQNFTHRDEIAVRDSLTEVALRL